jgi:hypothetical protein
MAHGIARLAEDSFVFVFVGDRVGFCVGEAVGLSVFVFVGAVGLAVGGFFMVGSLVGAYVSNESSQAHWHTYAQGNSPPANTLTKPNAERNS